jgi:hypothetical protein
MLPLQERAHYTSDHGVAWVRLPLLLAGGFGTALALAWVLKFAFTHGWYLLMLLPGIAGFILGGVLYGLVALAHCRNRWLAGLVGVLAGLTTYLGYYQLCLADFLPPGQKWNVTYLPRYIAFRMQTDVARDIAKPNAGPPQKPFSPLNWFGFGIELLMVTGAAAAFAAIRAGRAYCPELRQWMRQETALLPSNAGPGFLAAFDAGTLAQYAAATPLSALNQAPCRLILEYAVPGDGSAFDFPIYATFKESCTPSSSGKFRYFPPTPLKQVELEPAEVLALRPLFPNMTRLLEMQHAELRDLPAGAERAPTAESPVLDVAEVTPVPEPFRQRVRGPGYAVKVNLLGAIPLVYFLGGAAGVAGGIFLIVEGSIALGCGIAVVGAAAFAWGVYTAMYCLGVYENRWIERRLRQEIRQRSDVLVEAEDSESVYVSIIPREHFVKIKWTLASDLLLLKVDEKGRRLLMEGDTDRYRIPAGAIAVCEPQCFFHPIDTQHSNQLWMVRLMVQFEEDMRELLLSIGLKGWSPRTNARRRETAEALCLRVNGLRGEQVISDQ